MASPERDDHGDWIGRNGKPIENTYAPTLGLSYVPPQFGHFSFVAGSPPTAPGQVAIDQATAQRQGFGVGDMVSIVTAQPAQLHGHADQGLAQVGGVVGERGDGADAAVRHAVAIGVFVIAQGTGGAGRGLGSDLGGGGGLGEHGCR